ncbi:MAG TPA: hypothetical protein VFT22_34270, partial [Kofleriaceae bacterium]|nr:hypothetical protein [Kofleriaceae bacterium]
SAATLRVGQPRSRRGWWAAALGFVVAGGVIAVAVARGGAADVTRAPLAAAPSAPPEPAVAAPAPAPADPGPRLDVLPPSPPGRAPPTPPGPPPGPSPGPEAALAGAMRDLLTRFVAWSHDHAGAPCPGAAALGSVALDPWGHALQLTCADQPSNQVIGAVSAGPDGVPGNADDIGSWQLGRDVTDLVRGARWTAAPPAPAPPAKPSRASRPRREEDDIPRVR